MRCTGKELSILVNDLVISYSDEGMDDLPVVIFIHGFPLNKSMWDKQLEELKNDYRVIAYDIRGHGKSGSGSEEFSIELFSDDLIAFMDALDIKQSLICGFSMGGYIALDAITSYPEKFTGLVLANTQCKPDTADEKIKRKETIDQIQKYGLEEFADTSLQNLFTPDSFISKPGEIQAVKKMIISSKQDTVCKTLMAISNRESTCNYLHRIEVPVLIMTGADDHIATPDSSIFMHNKIMDSFLYIIDYTAHMSNMENERAFNHHLKKFLYQYARRQMQVAEMAY